jgi:membrane associated rhomboid family serine protease
MSSTPDLFVVCGQCGSEVSPYVTECPYCGNRLRKRAPNIPRQHVPSRAPRGLSGRLRVARSRGLLPAPSGARGRRPTTGLLTGSDTPPQATILLVGIGAVAWVVWHARPSILPELAIIGPLNGHWWRLFTSEFAYGNGIYAFITLLAVAIFGWLVERRHGPLVVLALFLGAGATGALAATALYGEPIVSGANGAALALLAVWAVPDLLAIQAGEYYEGDLLGGAAFAVILLAEPFAIYGVSWLTGVVGGLFGLLLGFGLEAIGERA